MTTTVRLRTVAVFVALALGVCGAAGAAPFWYDVSFTGADIWGYSLDNAGLARTDQAAPRRHADYSTGSRVLLETTYGLAGGLPTTGFNTWATGAGSGFAFREFNLWGAGGATSWGETYESVGTDPPDPGVSSWNVIQSPTGWTSGIVRGGDPWSADATHAFPVWRFGTGSMLSQSNMLDPSFVFEFQVLISNPESAFDSNGKLRVFFGGVSDIDQYDEVAGVMTLNADPIPEPCTLILLGGSLAGLAAARRRKKS